MRFQQFLPAPLLILLLRPLPQPVSRMLNRFLSGSGVWVVWAPLFSSGMDVFPMHLPILRPVIGPWPSGPL